RLASFQFFVLFSLAASRRILGNHNNYSSTFGSMPHTPARRAGTNYVDKLQGFSRHTGKNSKVKVGCVCSRTHARSLTGILQQRVREHTRTTFATSGGYFSSSAAFAKLAATRSRTCSRKYGHQLGSIPSAANTAFVNASISFGGSFSSRRCLTPGRQNPRSTQS